MERLPILLLVVAAVLAAAASVNSVRFGSTIRKGDDEGRIHRIEDISGDGRYILEWEINFQTQMIMFEVTVETTGFVGFGISPYGGMLLSDIVVGGVNPNGTVYFRDRYGSAAAGRPREDVHQDWVLVGASETETHTRLKFYRLLDTGDKEEDVVITPTAGAIIWSFGATDTLEYHFANRRSLELNLFEAGKEMTSKDNRRSLF